MDEQKNRRDRKPMFIVQAVLMACFGVLPASAYSLFDASQPGLNLKSLPKFAASRGSVQSPLTTIAWDELGNGDYQGAWRDFTKSIAANPRDASARAGRALLSVYQLDFNRALADVNYGLFAEPDNQYVHWVRGIVNLHINNYREALDDFKIYVTGSPDFPGGHLNLANTYRNLGDRQNAYSEYMQASALYGKDSPDRQAWCSAMAKAVQPGQAVGRDQKMARSIIIENLAKVYQASAKQKNGRSIFETDMKWPVGHTITVAFNGGEPALRKLIADTVPEWSKYGNIHFDFIDPNTGSFREWNTTDTKYGADVRISFADGPADGYYSVLGQQSINIVPPQQNSMNLDPTRWKELGTFYTGTILHEFGHALGFMHEHQHPHAGCTNEMRWLDDPGYQATVDNTGSYMADSAGRSPGLLSYYVTHDNWSPANTYFQIASYENTDHLALGPVDTKSIMQYAQDPSLLKNGKANPCYAEQNSVLSDGDKAAIKQQYPGATSN